MKADKWKKSFYLFVNIYIYIYIFFYSFFLISLQMSKGQLEVQKAGIENIT